jgi:DNA-directed RNA polymerase subunit RPC12/RpoP
MTRKLICQKCHRDTAAELYFDDDIDSSVYDCEHCGGRHVEVETPHPPGSPALSRFRLDEDD